MEKYGSSFLNVRIFSGFSDENQNWLIGREQSLRNESLQMSIAKSLLKSIFYEFVMPSRRLTAPQSYVISGQNLVVHIIQTL